MTRPAQYLLMAFFFPFSSSPVLLVSLLPLFSLPRRPLLSFSLLGFSSPPFVYVSS